MKSLLISSIFFISIVLIGITKIWAATFNIDFLNLREAQPKTITLDAYLKIKAIDAWQFLNSRAFNISPVTIGVIDTGVTSFHPEFKGVNFGNSQANAKIDFGVFNPDIEKVETHGTNVNGIIGANNISATSSVNYVFPHMSGIVSGVNSLEYVLNNRRIDLSGLGVSTLFSSVKNIFELANSGAKVINLSFGGSVFNPAALPTFFTTFSSYRDIVFVTAAGNNNIDAKKVIPAALGDNLDNVITVGGSTLLDGRESSSNFGSAVNIAAPADAVHSPKFFEEPLDLIGDYEFFSGTSAATPIVTGVAAILKALEPEYQKFTQGLLMSPAKIKEILIKSADPINTGEPDKLLGIDCFNFNPLVHTGCQLNALRAIIWLFPPNTIILNQPIIEKQ